MVQYLYLNCEIVDTPYGVLQSIGNKFIENFHQRIPFTGLSTDRVYSLLLEKLDEEKRVVIVALDEIDKLVQKNGDDILYQLLKINDDLSKARVSLIGISNELTFTEYLDPRVRSRLADEKMVFPPYNADELYDILAERSRLAFENGTAAEGVLHLIAALAAQEHGDARRALDLLRVSAELAERQGEEHITEEHVQRAKNKIELDTVIEAAAPLIRPVLGPTSPRLRPGDPRSAPGPCSASSTATGSPGAAGGRTSSTRASRTPGGTAARGGKSGSRGGCPNCSSAHRPCRCSPSPSGSRSPSAGG